MVNQLLNFSFFISKKEISYKIKFTESCIYDLNKIGLYGVNKVFGLTWGIMGVHNNSARFGWKPLDKSRIMIYAYVYFGGIKKEIEICTVNINEYYTLSISEKKEKIVFNVKNQIKNSGSTLELKCPKLPKLGYTNFLYFGGSKKNQQDIIIEMEKVK